MGGTSRIRSRSVLRSRVAVAVAIAVVAQIPSQAIALNEPPVSPVTTGSPTTCAVPAPADPPIWERTLPTTKVSPTMSAQDPGCVREVGRTATSVVWRGQDQKLTARLYGSPVNFKADDGSWQPIDTRLVPDGKGGIANKAGPFSVHFGAAASQSSLVSLTENDSSLSFGLDGALQSSSSALLPPSPTATPVVGGSASDTLTYADALPGVDVRYQVLGQALKEELVLNRPLATGISPQFKFTVSMSGLRPDTATDGTIQFVNSSSGKVVFKLPAGTAFDASGDSSNGTSSAIAPVSVKLVSDADPAMATIIVGVDGEWLNDPARVFPVVIDPTTLTDTTSSDAYVRSLVPTTPCDGSCQNGGFLGYLDPSGNDTTNGTMRSLLSYPSLAGLAGETVTSATWNGYALFGAGTTPMSVTLNPVNAAWTAPSVTWNTQPAVRTDAASVTFSGTSGWLSTDITSWAQNWSSGVWGEYGIRLSGPATANTSVYFDAQEDPPSDQSYLQVNYDLVPWVSTTSGGGQYSSPYVRTATPTLLARINDNDTPSGLSGHFEVWNNTKTILVASGASSTVSNGQQASWSPPAALPDGIYWWRVSPDDGTELGSWYPWTPLVVDTAVPHTPTVSSASVALNAWRTSGGSSMTASLGSNGSTDVYWFEWGVDVGQNPTQMLLATGGTSGTLTLSPTWGWHDLAVRAIDLAGNVSSVFHFTFGWGNGGLSVPQTGSTTQKRVTVQVNTTTGYSGISLQWRRSESDTWVDIPPAQVTNQTTGLPVSAWPVSSTTGTYFNASPVLVWDAATAAGNVDGALQVRAGFYNGTYSYLTDTPSIPNLTLDQNAFGNNYATAPVGAGRVNLLTGNLLLSSTDVAVPGNSVSRSFQSRNPSTTGSVFGPGWTSSIQTGGAPYRQLVDNSSTVLLTSNDGSIMSFRKQPSGTYLTPDGNGDLTLTKVTGTPTKFTLRRANYTTAVTFTNISSNLYLMTGSTDETGATASTTWALVGGIAQPTFMFAAPASGITCTTSNYNTSAGKGCQTVTFAYATATTSTSLCGGTFGDVNGQLRSINFTAWDPDLGTPAMHTVSVANYCYDTTTHLLRTVWDPRISPNLVTAYSYNANGQVATVTPPGESAATFTYAPLAGEPAATGRLSTISRPTLPPASGTATMTMAYQIPLTVAAGGPDNLDPTSTAAWAQHDNPTDATAIYPPDQIPSGSPPSSYSRATVYYLDANEQVVNLRAPGDHISTSEHDKYGHVIRTLTPSNRDEALASSTSPASQATEALLIDTENTYDPTGIQLVDSFGPAHTVTPSGGMSTTARQHTHNAYDEGSPGFATYNLLTKTTESAAPTDGSAEQDSRMTTNAYTVGADSSGWTLGKPLQVTVDPNLGGSGHLNLSTTTKYSTTGNLIARTLPANPTGGDAHETDFLYYAAGTGSGDAACDNHPEYATLLCKTQPAAQPGTSGLPNLATSQVTKYNMWGEAETTVDTNGSDSRTTTIGYDAAGRQITQSINATIGASLPQVTTGYNTSTGRLRTTTDGTRTTTRTYDTLGRLSSYQDADGNTTNYTYDILDNVLTVNDAKATTTYTYNTASEPRGFPTGISDSQVAGLTFSGFYDADGRLDAQVDPGSHFVVGYGYDEAGEQTSIGYYASGTWPTENATYNIHGERVTDTGAAFDAYTYAYDAAGRLTQTNETQLLDCVQRNYAFDADSNRTQLSTTIGGVTSSPCPPTGTPTITNSTYDAADRSTTSGYAYDAFGRTIAVAPAESPTGFWTVLSYYTNDLVNTATANGTTLTYNLDPNRDVRTWSSSADGQTHTNHFTSDSGNPAWTTENTAGTNWTRYIHGFAGLGATVNQAGTVSLQLANIHGDIFSTVTTTETNWLAGIVFTGTATWNATDEYGRPDTGITQPIGTRYDYLGTAQRQRDTNSGLQLMGQRAYNPTTGRFLQTDPVLGGSANTYDYSNADPVNSSDLTGQSSCHACDVWIWVTTFNRNNVAKWMAAVHYNDRVKWLQAEARSQAGSSHYARLLDYTPSDCYPPECLPGPGTAGPSSGYGMATGGGSPMGTACGDVQCAVSGGSPSGPPSQLWTNIVHGLMAWGKQLLNSIDPNYYIKKLNDSPELEAASGYVRRY
jgi:RHS repeat-associated protein